MSQLSPSSRTATVASRSRAMASSTARVTALMWCPASKVIRDKSASGPAVGSTSGLTSSHGRASMPAHPAAGSSSPGDVFRGDLHGAIGPPAALPDNVVEGPGGLGVDGGVRGVADAPTVVEQGSG